MILNVAGARLLHEVEGLFEKAEQVLKDVASPQVAGRLTVSIGSDHSWYFVPRISRYLNKNPRVELSLQVYRAPEAIADLQRGVLDLALGIFPNLPRGLQKDVVAESTMALLCPAGHPVTRRRPPRLDDIALHRLIFPPAYSESRKIIDRVFAKAGIQIDDVIEVANCGTSRTFVEHGVGLALVHSLCVSHTPSPKLQWLDLGKLFGRIEFAVAYRQGRAPSIVLQGLLDELSRMD
jgi:DNA-binding transcriptional LysR family regulator